MAVTNYDTFTDTAGTDILSHTGELGASYSIQFQETGMSAVITAGGRLRPSAKALTIQVLLSGIPAAADLDFRAWLTCQSLSTSQFTGIACRVDTTGPTWIRSYYVSDSGGTPRWLLEKKVNNVNTTLGTFNQTLTATQTYLETLRARGNDFTVFVDNVSRITATDAAVPNAGKILLEFYLDTGDDKTPGDAQHVQFDKIEVEEWVDATIWQLPVLDTPLTTDILASVDAPGGTPANKKVTISDFIKALALSNVVVQTLTAASGTYTPTTNMKKVLAIAVGSGGAGAGGVNTDSAGGGGGGGGTCIRLLTAAQIGASKSYVVGQANTGNPTQLDAAGALLNASGGGAGTAGSQGGVISGAATGGAGGAAANGDLNIPGQPGGNGIVYSGTDGMGGKGGNSVFGFGGAHGGSNVAGGNGSNYGGGGAGGHAATATDKLGGTGAAGVLYMIEFID